METAPMMSFAGFLIAWVAMMAAMMLPAVLPVVRAYARAATGSAAPAIVFVAGYLALWSATGIPAFWAWSHLNGPLAHGSPWVGRLAGAIALAAGIYQLTPLKAACLRHCYWPLSVSRRAASTTTARPGRFVPVGATASFVWAAAGCCS